MATVKKTTTATAAKKSAPKASGSEISVNGNKKIATLKKEFNQKFPYIRLYIYNIDPTKRTPGTPFHEVDHSKTLAAVRRVNSGGAISINGNKKVKTLEKEFNTVFGLYAQVGWVDKNGTCWYSTGISDEKTLAQINEDCQKDGHLKGTNG